MTGDGLAQEIYDVAHRGGGVPTMFQLDNWTKEAKRLKACESFAELVRDFFTDDSAGHAMYLKEQAEHALVGYKLESPPLPEGF